MKKIVLIFSIVMLTLVASTPNVYAGACNPQTPGCINTIDIAADAVTSAKILDGTISTADIAPGAVTDAEITGPISASKIEKPANVIIVAKSGGDFPTITEALATLDDPNTTPTVIKVMPGTYLENRIQLKSLVNIQGSGKDVTIIDDYIQSYPLFEIAYGGITDVEISGFTLRGAAALIDSNGYQTPDQKVTIKDNRLVATSTTTTTYGIIMNYCSPYSEVSNNTFEGLTYGIWLGACKANITHNIFAGSRDAIYDDGTYGVETSEAIISNNYIADSSRYGISVNGSSATIKDNTVKNSDDAGIYIRNSSVKVVNNDLDANGRGIYDRDPSSIILIRDNVIKNSAYHGIDSNSSYAQITSNVVTDNNVSDQGYYDISMSDYSKLSFNVFDTKEPSVPPGIYNIDSNNNPWQYSSHNRHKKGGRFSPAFFHLKPFTLETFPPIK